MFANHIYSRYVFCLYYENIDRISHFIFLLVYYYVHKLHFPSITFWREKYSRRRDTWSLQRKTAAHLKECIIKTLHGKNIELELHTVLCTWCAGFHPVRCVYMCLGSTPRVSSPFMYTH